MAADSENLESLSNHGTAVMLNGTAAIVVAHGLPDTPNMIHAIGTQSEVQSLYITAIGAANFTINTNDGDVTANRDIMWQAEIRF